MDEGLQLCMLSDDPKVTQVGVTVAMLYFGLLHITDALKIEQRDIYIQESGEKRQKRCEL